MKKRANTSSLTAMPCSNRTIRLASERFEIRFDYDRSVIEIVKQCLANWSPKDNCWSIPISKAGARLASRLKKRHGFQIEPQAEIEVDSLCSETELSVSIAEGSIRLAGLSDPKLAGILRERRTSRFDFASDTWSIEPSFEAASLLLQMLQDRQIGDAKTELVRIRDAASLLDRSSKDGKIIFEEDDPVPDGIAIALGSQLPRVCKNAEIDFRTAIAYGHRPFPRSIGVAFAMDDLAKFQNALAKQTEAKTEKTKRALSRFALNPSRTSLTIHADATPWRWAFKVFNGSKVEIHSASGVTTRQPKTVNSGEFEAMISALSWLVENPCRSATVLSDSQTTLRILHGGNVHAGHLAILRDEALQLIRECRERTPTEAKWIPGKRNKADSLSRNAESVRTLLPGSRI